jgi:DHA1 family inner membrane transport protein
MTESERPTRRGIVVMALLAGLIAAGHVGKLPPALPSIRAELGLDIVTASWLASMFSATGMTIAIFLGAIADRLDHWRLAIGGLALMAVSGFGGSLVSGAPQLIASRFLEGIGFLAVVVAAPSIIADAASGRERRMALGLWPGYMPSGVSIMILAAPLVLQVGGWRGLWIAVAVLAAAGAAVMLLVGRSAHGGRVAASGAALWKNIRLVTSRSGPWLLGGCFALYGAQLYAIMTWMPTFMIEERGTGAGAAAALTALVVAVNGLCNVLGGWLLHRGARPWAMIAASGGVMAISAFGTFSILFPDIARYAFSLALCGAGGVVASAVFAIAPLFATSSAQTGTVNGVLVQASNLAQFAGPTALAAAVSEFGRWESALWVMVAVNVLMIALALLVHRQEKMLPA